MTLSHFFMLVALQANEQAVRKSAQITVANFFCSIGLNIMILNNPKFSPFVSDHESKITITSICFLPFIVSFLTFLTIYKLHHQFFLRIPTPVEV